MSDCRFGVSPVNYPNPDPDPETSVRALDTSKLYAAILSLKKRPTCMFEDETRYER